MLIIGETEKKVLHESNGFGILQRFAPSRNVNCVNSFCLCEIDEERVRKCAKHIVVQQVFLALSRMWNSPKQKRKKQSTILQFLLLWKSRRPRDDVVFPAVCKFRHTRRGKIVYDLTGSRELAEVCSKSKTFFTFSRKTFKFNETFRVSFSLSNTQSRLIKTRQNE
jgi:hypothetical protein